jgi:hypothetical protein
LSAASPGLAERLFALGERIEYSTVGSWIGESRFGYPIIEGVHLIGLAVAVGLLFVVDLRLLGLLLRQVPVHDLMRQLRPWIIWGFVAIFVTGALLFWSSAGRMLDSPAFAVKVVLLAIGTLNALHFELKLAHAPAVRDNPAVLPANIRRAAGASLAIWTLAIVFGRMTAYLPHWATLWSA